MENNKQAASSGIGFGGLLAILFIGLKLIGFIDWSWVWVLFPLWLPLVVVGFFLGVAFLLMFLGSK